jgi:hypothetical protein
MCPVKSVGMTTSPASFARSRVATSRAIIAVSTLSGAGWKSSQTRNKRIESNPHAAMRAKSAAVSERSKSAQKPIAVRAGQ